MLKVAYSLSRPVVAVNAETRIDLQIDFELGQVQAARRPLNLSLVLDRSGSMGGKPLKQAIRASKLLVDQLTGDDILSIVTYDDHIRTILAPQRVEDKAAIKGLLDQVRAGGITNLSGGWLEGCEHTRSSALKGGINRVLLLTDGQANMGITDNGELIRLARKEAEKGVITTTLGFGSYFNEDLLIGMADAAGGNFYFIQSPEDAADVFNIEVEGLASVVADNLEVTIEPQPGVTIAEVLNNYKHSSHPEGLKLEVGEVYGIEPKPINLTLKVCAPVEGITTLARVAFTYDAKIDDRLELQNGTLAPAIRVGSLEEAAVATLNTSVVEQTSRLRIGKIKEAAVGLADNGQFAKAAEILREVIEDLKGQGLDENFEIAEEIDQLDHYARLFDRGNYGTANRKEIMDQSYQARTRGRGDLKLRGTSSGSTDDLTTVTFKEGEEKDGAVVECVRQGGKLRVHVVSDGYDSSFNVQFPRAIRQEGARYLVERIELSANGAFYRAGGKIQLLLRPGETRSESGGTRRKGTLQKADAKSLADVPTTDDVGDGVLIQIVKDKSKLRARVVSDGYDPDKNMRFPRSIRQEGVLFVVDEVKESGDGSYYIAYGKIRRLV